MGPTEADDKQPLGCITRGFFYLLFLLFHKNYFTLSPVQGLRYLTTSGFSEAGVRKKVCHCKKHKFVGSGLRPNLSLRKTSLTCLMMCSKEYRNNIDEALKNKPAEPEKC